MKLKLTILISSIMLLLSSCDPEGLHVGHVVESRSTSGKIIVKWHDIDKPHEWVNGYSNSRAYKILKKKYDVLFDDEILIIVGDLSSDLILKDTVVKSINSYEVSQEYQNRYLSKIEKVDELTQEDKDRENRRFISVLIAISVAIFIFMTGFKLKRLISTKLEMMEYKRNILLQIKYYLSKKGNTWDRDKIEAKLRSQGFEFSAIKSALDELEDETYGNN